MPASFTISCIKVYALGLDAVGTLFYKTLFTDHPEALPLFLSFKDEPDMFNSEKFLRHARKLVASVSGAVEFLNQPDKLIPKLQRLGVAHIKVKGIIGAHFDVVGNNLIKVLSIALGDKFTPEACEAWQEVYGIMASVMKKEMAL